MLSTHLGRWLRHDRLLAAALMWLAVSTITTLLPPTLGVLELGLVLAGALMLLGCLPLDRFVIGLAVVGCLAVAWVNWLGLQRSAVAVVDTVSISGTVVELPAVGEQTNRLTVAVSASSVPLLIRQRVTLDVATATDIPAGSSIQATARPLRVSQNTLRLDPVRNLVAHLAADSVSEPVLDYSGSATLVRIRDQVVRRSAQLWQQPPASLAAGLVVGNRANFDVDLAAAMRTTGTTHLVAVSGQNLIVVFWVLRLVLPRRRPWVRDSLLMIGLVGFALLSGGTASVVRAVILATTLLIAKLIGRPTHILRLLILVAAAMVFANPFLPIFDLGFQLSFVATASLVTLGPWLAAKLPGPRAVSLVIGISLGAYLATAPIIAGSFGIVSLSSPLVNIIVQPLTMSAMVAAAASIGLSFIWLPLGHLLAWISWPILAAIIGIVQWFAHQSIPVLALEPPAWLVWLVTAFLILAPAWAELQSDSLPEESAVML